MEKKKKRKKEEKENKKKKKIKKVYVKKNNLFSNFFNSFTKDNKVFFLVTDHNKYYILV